MTKPLNKAEAIRLFRETGRSKDEWHSFCIDLLLCEWITRDQFAHWGRL